MLCNSEDTVDIAIYVNGTPWGCVLNTESLMMVPLGAVFLPGEFHEEAGRPELDMTEQLTHTHTHTLFPTLPYTQEVGITLGDSGGREDAFSSVGSQRSGPFRKVQLPPPLFQMDSLFSATQAWM